MVYPTKTTNGLENPISLHLIKHSDISKPLRGVIDYLFG